MYWSGLCRDGVTIATDDDCPAIPAAFGAGPSGRARAVDYVTSQAWVDDDFGEAVAYEQVACGK